LKLASLARRDVTTRRGAIPLWSAPGALAGSRPLVLAVQGLLAGPDDLADLPAALGHLADVTVTRLAPEHADPVAFAEGLAELVDTLFAARPVVLAGVSLGAVAAMAVRARSVRRIVAVEPVLAARGLSELLGDLRLPVDVLLGRPDAPPAPGRRPSLVGAAERAVLAAAPRVRLHLAPGAGHDVAGEASKALTALLSEACRRAAAEPAFDPEGLDEPLVEAVPLDARRVLHWGPGDRAFAGACLSWNPDAAIEALGEDPAAEAPDGAAFDVLALGSAPPPGLLPRLAARLAAGGLLVARWAPGDDPPAEVRAELAAAGFGPAFGVDATGTGVLRARRRPPRPLRRRSGSRSSPSRAI
jgi:dienelactone hydrolase